MNAKPVLVVSLVANLALGAALLWNSHSAKSTPEPGAPAAASNAPARVEVRTKTSSPEAAAAPAAAAQKFDWRLVESEDYRKYIANLRAIGCPEETIRDIIVADVNKLFESRKKEIKGSSTKKFEYWKAGNMFAAMVDPDLLEKQQALAKEKRELLIQLLGSAPDEKPDLMAGFNPFEQMLDFLPSSKQTALMEIMQKYQAKMMKGLSGGQPDAEDMKNMQKTQKEMEAEMSKILTPDEYEAYQLRMSQTAMVMRMQLASFDPNEQEFKDLFKYKKAYDDEFGLMGMGALTGDEKTKAEAAKKQMDASIKAALGDARYTDYERSQDWNFQNIYRVTERNGLTKDDAIKVYDMKKVAEEQAGKVRLDNNLNPDQKTAALQGIRTETENSMQSVMGQKAFSSYQNQAYWLNAISPAPKAK